MDQHVSFEQLQAELRGVSLPMGLVLDQVLIQSGHASFQLEEQSVLASPEVALVARISPESLTRFLESQLPAQIRQVAVQYDPPLVAIDTVVRFIVDIQVQTKVVFEIKDESDLFVVVKEVDKPGPVRAVIEAQLAQTNPVFSKNTLPFPVKLRKVEVLPEWVEITLSCNLADVISTLKN